LVGFISSSNRKTIGIPQEGDAYLMVFFGVLANENWKVASQACYFHRLPLSNEFNTLIVFYEQHYFSLFSSFNDLRKICLLGESTKAC
jgi:hypothetical protein